MVLGLVDSRGRFPWSWADCRLLPESSCSSVFCVCCIYIGRGWMSFAGDRGVWSGLVCSSFASFSPRSLDHEGFYLALAIPCVLPSSTSKHLRVSCLILFG